MHYHPRKSKIKFDAFIYAFFKKVQNKKEKKIKFYAP